MGRPKMIAEYHEGPKAAENFGRAMQTILAAGRPAKALITERIDETIVTTETQHVVARKPRTRKK